MLLLCALCALCFTEAWGVGRTAFTLDGLTRDFTATPDALFVSTQQSLYQFRPDLSLVGRVSQRGVLLDARDPGCYSFSRSPEGAATNATFLVNVLLPFIATSSLVLCGVWGNGGYCEVRSLQNVSSLLYSENILLGPLGNYSASVALLVTGGLGHTYILTATEPRASFKKSQCTTDRDIFYLLNTDNRQKGGIFSDLVPSGSTTLTRRKNERGDAVVDVGFVDGFQEDSYIYLLSNARSPAGNQVRLLWLEAKDKASTMRSLRGSYLTDVGARELLASSVISGTTPLTWSGVFSVDGSPANTELLLFNISHDQVPMDRDPHFCSNCKSTSAQPKILSPLKMLMKQSYMSSVMALKVKHWLLFFIGTADGQLFKLAVDKNYHTSCPRVLYRANDDSKLFPKLHVDQVYPKHVYVVFANQIMSIPVSKCSSHTSLHACWSAQDPLCVWCDSSQSCTHESDCRNQNYTCISEDFQQEKMVSHRIEMNAGQISVIIQTHTTPCLSKPSNFGCHFSPPCEQTPSSQFPTCTCILSNSAPLAPGLDVTVTMHLWKTSWTENINIMNCSDLRGTPSPALCRQCISAGCGWSSGGCSWANTGSTNESICQKLDSGINYMKPTITSINPPIVSLYGKNHALLMGKNLSHVTRVRVQAQIDCSPRESPVWDNTDVALTFHIPPAEKKGVASVCVVQLDGLCHGDAQITYRSSPSCNGIRPSSTWLSGGRNIMLIGSHLNFIETIAHSHSPQTVHFPNSSSSQNLTYITPAAKKPLASMVYLKVANQTVNCSTTISYHPDPVFSSYTSIKTGVDASITIQKKLDQLDISPEELTVWAVGKGKNYLCKMESKETSNETDFYTCEIKNTPDAEFEYLMIRFGDSTVMLKPESSYLLLILLVLLLIPCIIIVVVVVYLKKQNQMTTHMNTLMENLEMDIRNDIRQGFIDLQTENAELLENIGTIPFLDYKHFASRIFFPESELLMKSCIKEIGQDGAIVQLDECGQGLYKLIRDQLFLTSMVHALEEQKSFSIKDKCVLASLLTVSLHGDLCYLTEVMEVLLRDLMKQSSNTQPKLLLRRTESTVEKLLTNWMSICLYGFVRESVGQQLFLIVSALTQQISKGPVDCVTEKALYTLSEDWLLWQAQDFQPLKLKVLFAVGSDGELSEPLEVMALTCDTVDQVKEKILCAFRTKFGFPYNIPLRELCIEYMRGSASLRLEEVDLSSERLGDVTMLNTMKHYKIPDEATIKVISRKTHTSLSHQGSVKDDKDYSGKYFHLIDPDVVEDIKTPERKKLKLKEVHLTKLLSTKVAVHSFVEKLFRSIWGLQHNRAPFAVKYFFDFLDAQAEDMRISDPDVLHIWKTNSLPLRFWVNIMKNPQFVFDLEKSPHLDGCLSVVAQAFMDSFSLSDTQLGKHTPTNKLLYAKEIPIYKQEVKVYYQQIQNQPSLTETEFQVFLQNESKKHENEFNEMAMLRELYKFIHKYFTEIQEKLDQNGAPSELKEQLHHVKKLFDGLKSCS